MSDVIFTDKFCFSFPLTPSAVKWESCDSRLTVKSDPKFHIDWILKWMGNNNQSIGTFNLGEVQDEGLHRDSQCDWMCVEMAEPTTDFNKITSITDSCYSKFTAMWNKGSKPSKNSDQLLGGGGSGTCDLMSYPGSWKASLVMWEEKLLQSSHFYGKVFFKHLVV